MKELTEIFKNPFSNPTGEKLEKKILNLLKKDLSPKEIFEKIKASSDVEQVSRFLYNSALDKTLLEFSVKRLEKRKPIAWPYIIKIFIKYKITPSKQLEQLLFHHWLKHEENQSQALFACREWGDVSPQFQQLYSVYIQELEEKELSKERDLLEKLEFVQAQKLIKEEEEIITQLLLIDSKNSKYKKLQIELEEKKAFLIIEEQKKLADAVDPLEGYIFPASDEEGSLKESWFKTVSTMAERNPKNTKNLALFLYFCGWPDKALKILDRHVSQISDYWLYLEWVLETKEYTKGLELINRLFVEMKESESFFLPLVYIKAQLLYALGKKSEAIEHLTAISQVQPNYRSTQHLLDKWLKNL